MAMTTQRIPPAPAKEIATLPPLPVLRGEIPLSKRTGEPPRPWSVVVGLVLFCLAAAAIGMLYGRHWWMAAHPDSYSSSAQLIQWLQPAPGMWLSLTLEGVLAIVATLVAGACAVAGFQAWNGWGWSRITAGVALALTACAVAVFDLFALVAVGLAGAGTLLVLLPSSQRYYQHFLMHRAQAATPYRRPAKIIYGRLPRFQ